MFSLAARSCVRFEVDEVSPAGKAEVVLVPPPPMFPKLKIEEEESISATPLDVAGGSPPPTSKCKNSLIFKQFKNPIR